MFIFKILTIKMASLTEVRRHLTDYDGFIQTSSDAHCSEYVANCDKRREALTGFTGSNGTVIFSKTSAAMWTDSRYFIQAETELLPEFTLMKFGRPETPSYATWIKQNFSEGCWTIKLAPDFV